MNQLSLFAEENLSFLFGERSLNAQLGLRYDRANGIDHLSPRVNLSFDIVPKWFTLRGGYGIAAKAPTLHYFYPDNAYFDLVNLQHPQLLHHSRKRADDADHHTGIQHREPQFKNGP